MFRTSKEDGCLVGLLCDSTDESVTISWKLDPRVKSFNVSLDGKSSFLLVLFNKTQHVESTCTSSINTEDFTSSSDTLSCEGEITALGFFTVSSGKISVKCFKMHLFTMNQNILLKTLINIKLKKVITML